MQQNNNKLTIGEHMQTKIAIFILSAFLLSSCSGVVKCNNFAKKAVHEVLFPICNSY